MPGIRARAISGAARLVGLPWRLRPGKGKPPAPDDPRLKRILVIKPCCMGDVLMSTPAIAALRRALPEAHIALAVGQWSRPAVADNPRLNNLIDPTVRRTDTGFAGLLRTARLLRRGRFGAALILDRSPLLNLVAYLAGVPVRAGLDSDGRGLALTHPVYCPPNARRHEVEWYLDVVRALGIDAPLEDAYLEFYPTKEDRREAEGALSTLDGSESGSIALHLGGGANPGMNLPSKRWRPERWARVADWLAETYEANILLLGGPGAEDRQAAEAFKGALFPATRPYVADLVGKLQWGGTAALIEQCNLFLGHDTGAMHLAIAMRTPAIAVFGPSDPLRYGPWDPSGRSVAVGGLRVEAGGRKAAGSGAEALREASRSGEPYHDAVTVEEVWAAVERALAAMPTRARG